MSIFTSFLLMFPLTTYIGVFFLRITAWCFVYRDPVHIIVGSGMSFAITTGLIAAVALIIWFIIRPFDTIVRKIKREGYVPTLEEKRKCLASYRKFIVAVIVGNIIGFIIGQSSSTIVEDLMGINPLNPYLFGFCLAQSIGVGANCALIIICAINELMGRYRVLLDIKDFTGFEKNKNASIRFYLYLTFFNGVYLSIANMLCVPSGLLFNPESQGFGQLALYTHDIFMAAALSIVYCVIPFFIVLLGLKHRIKSTTDVIQNISKEGDLKKRINLSLLDDFGLMLSSINQLMNNLTTMLKNIQSGTDSVNQSAQELSSISSVAGQAIGKVNAAFDNISTEVSHQNNAIQHVNQNAKALVEGVTVVIKNVGEQTDALTENSNSILRMTENIANVAQLSHEADRVSRELTVTSDQGKDALLAAVAIINEIEKSAEEVRAVIQNIENIAEQTNLLSMNASIEAAHAGESGKGFAVVAGEVRKLAGETSKSAKNIQDHMAAMLEKVKAGVDTINNAGTSFKNIAEQVQKNAALIDTITSETENQRQGADLTMKNTREILESIESLRTLTTQQGDYASALQSAMDSVLDSSQKTATVIDESNSATSDLENVLNSVEHSVSGNLSAVETMKTSVDMFSI